MLIKADKRIHTPAACTLLKTTVWLQHTVCRFVSTGLQTLRDLIMKCHQILEKVTCTVQQLGTLRGIKDWVKGF